MENLLLYELLYLPNKGFREQIMWR